MKEYPDAVLVRRHGVYVGEGSIAPSVYGLVGPDWEEAKTQAEDSNLLSRSIWITCLS